MEPVVPSPLLASFAALLFAHAVADYLLQSGWIVANKRRPAVLLMHVGIVALANLAVLGLTPWKLALAVAAIHLVMDAAKTYLMPDRQWSYLADQAVHVATIAALVPLLPGWDAGIWPGLLPHVLPAPLPAYVPAVLAAMAGLILTTRAGGFAVAYLVRPFLAADADLRRDVEGSSLASAGAMIGMLERGLAFVLILSDNVSGIALMIAAKSLLRLEDSRKSRKMAEYIIIGTLASIGWALLTSLATRALLHRLLP